MIDHIAIPEERMKILRKNKKFIEQLKSLSEVDVELNDEIYIEGEPLKVLRVKEVLKAFGRGFDFDSALNLLDEDYYLEVIDVRDFAKKSRSRIVTLKGRVIGTKGKTKRLIEKYAEVKLSVYGKTISIIGKWDRVMVARQAIDKLLLGSLHSTVYRFLEKYKK
ncbi:MAG: KH domain-containing protein [Candidatus Aenigmarchaeota archaeon]|nr:KH domain-containing protein [Candidatus Aenigmarchaeota archaeon]